MVSRRMVWFRTKLAVAGASLLFGLAAACAKPPASGDAAGATSTDAHAWKVFILDVSDAPGPILSTAGLPPGAKPATHPFLSASARSLSLLRADGFKVVPSS